MRSILGAVLVAAGIGLAGISGAHAAPVSGVAIDQAASANALTQHVGYHHYHGRHWRHHHHWHWRHHHHRRCYHWRHHSRARCFWR